MKTWMRILTVTLTSKMFKKKITFGENYLKGEDDLEIEVTGNKYPSTLKDSFVVRITNITYKEIVQIIQGQFFDIEIKAGYRTCGAKTIFKGGVLWVSNETNEDKSTSLILLCSSNLVAKFGQQRINLSLNSGINRYAAMNYINYKAGITNSNISTQFKKQFFNEIQNIDSTVGSFYESLISSNDSYFVNVDESNNDVITIFDANYSNARVINLKNENFILIGGLPQLTSEGVEFYLQPTFSFMCGDVVHIDNSLIQIPVTSQSEFMGGGAAKANYLNSEGNYMIMKLSYNLQNRGSNFNIKLLCKSRNYISSFTGK